MNQNEIEQKKKVVLSFMQDSLYVPMKEKELAIVLQVAKEERELLRQVLDELLSEGKIEVSKRGKYSIGSEKMLMGTFTSHPNGFGFVTVEGETEDYFVPENKVNGAFHNDTVQIIVLPGQRGKRKEAQVVKVVTRGVNRVVGIFQKNKNFGFVLPDNQRIASDIFIPIEKSKNAVTGHKVVCEITDYGDDRRKPEGKITEIIGHVNDPGVDILSIVKGFDLPMEFPERVMNQAERVSDEVSEADMAGRKDLRDLLMVTIDGEDAKDLDDAVSLSKEGDIYHLGVHIADVSNYVQERSALDREALERGTSVYLVDRVIPMLPHVLSNGICSLNERQVRLALSCLMDINSKGEVVDYQITESVIQTNHRMTYTSVNKIVSDHDEEEIEKYKDVADMFFEMKELADILREKRRKRGSIDFDFPETKIILDPQGRPIDIKPYERNAATKIIEDFMLIANETVAQHFYWLEAPFVYRTHDNPDTEKIMKLATFINNFGYSLKTTQEEIHPKELQKLLAKIADSPEEALISRLTLRSMKQARYTTDCTGHFGLACQYYCHFTSPIRRYPDLQIHRIIKDQLRGRLTPEKMDHYREILDGVAKRSSEMERRADEAERETDKLKKVEYMSERIGNYYEGVISGVTSWGVYVELPNTIEGMVHISKIPGDYYYYDEEHYEMVGQATGRTWKLGQKVMIRVDDVDKISRTIDFAFLEKWELEELEELEEKQQEEKA